MAGLSSDLYHQCRRAFMQCNEFESNAALRAVFVTDELAPFASALPEASTKAGRVDATLAYLLEKRLRDGRGALPLFVAALRDRYDTGDALWDELDALLRALLGSVENRRGERPRPKIDISEPSGAARLTGLAVGSGVTEGTTRTTTPTELSTSPVEAGTTQRSISPEPALMKGTAQIPQRVTIEPAGVAQPDNAPDLELLVSLSANEQRLTYTLHSPGGDYHHQEIGSVRLAVPPREILQHTFDRLSTLARLSPKNRTAEQTRRAEQELADIGSNLYAELFPPELKSEYRRLRAKHTGGNLLITSNEPWIPWEMIKPVAFDADGQVIYDDPPLCEMFKLARWAPGRAAPSRIAIHSAALIQPPGNLKATSTEARFFAELSSTVPDIATDASLQSVDGVLDAFRAGTTQLYHFACHGNFDLSDPNESKLRLADGFLSPSRLVGDRQSGLRRAKPLVFLNACHSGERGHGLTRLGGWAERFIDAGASVFIGSLWEINDEMAARFAVEFYGIILGLVGRTGTSLAEAVRDARRVLRATDPANPTWLAYVLYGDPGARVMLPDGGRTTKAATTHMTTGAANPQSRSERPFAIPVPDALSTNSATTANPFLDTGRITDPARFFDRQKLLDQIIGLLRFGSNVSLVGPSEIGKSSILSMICTVGPARLRMPPTSFAFLTLEWVDTEDEFYEALCDAFGIETCRSYKLTRALRGRKYVLCLDEFEKMKWEGFTSRLRSHLRGLADGQDAPLKLVIASRSPLASLFPDSRELDSPLANICRQIDVGPFSPGIARDFIIERLGATGIRFTEDETGQLLADSAGHPAKLQQRAAKLFDHYSRLQD